MAFENLADRLQEALGKLTGKGKLNEKDIDTAMREIRLCKDYQGKVPWRRCNEIPISWPNGSQDSK